MKARTITNTPEVAEAVRGMLAEGKTTEQVRAWLFAQPEFRDIYVPTDFKYIRKTLGVAAGHGGMRQNCTGRHSYKVHRMTGPK